MPYGKKRYSSRGKKKSSGSARSSRARSTGPLAPGRRYRAKNPSRRSPVGKAAYAGIQPIGAAKYLTQYTRLPRYTRIERAMEKAGVAILQWKLFQSYERFHVQPLSGYCAWAALPHKLNLGTVVSAPTLDRDYMPNNCDLYDVARKMVQYFKDNGGAGTVGNWMTDNEVLTTSELIKQTAGDGVGSSATAANQFGPTPRLRGIQIKNNKVWVSMENVSSIDAFVEEYELYYSRPTVIGTPWAAWTGTISKTTMKPLLGDAYIGGWDAATNSVKSYVADGSTTNDPSLFDVYRQIPANTQLNPYDGTYFDQRQYGTRLGGCALEAYARCCLNHRLPQTLIRPFDTNFGAREPQSTVSTPTSSHLLCHPMNDPLLAWPEGVRQTHGWRLRRVKKAYCLKPGAAHKVTLPVNTAFLHDFAAFPRVADKEADILAKANGWGDMINTVIRDAVSLPKTMTFRCFRVHGDMIHSNVAGTDAYGDQDYQTGSCRVQFSVHRSLCARLCATDRAKEPQNLFAFDTSVAVANQEAMNDETDVPAVLAIGGDV